MGQVYYRITFGPDVEIRGKRSFWMKVIRESATIVVGWELTEEGDRTHRQHVIEKALIKMQPARMNPTYATMEIS